METKFVSSVTEYIQTLKDILDVTDKEINSQMEREYMSLLEYIYSDRVINNYIQEYERKNNRFWRRLIELQRKESSINTNRKFI